MLDFVMVNVNPKGRKTCDCTTRALAHVLNLTYSEAIALQTRWAIKECYGLVSKQTIESILNEFGYVKCKQPRRPDGRKYTVADLDLITSAEDREHGILVSVAGHYTTVFGSAVHDTWDCRDYTICNYYVKG